MIRKPHAMTIQQASELTRLSSAQVQALIGAGRLRTFKIGPRTLIPYGDLERLMEDLGAAVTDEGLWPGAA